MGMLRSTEEYDLIMTLAYEGAGTMQVGGQPCNVSRYRSDITYQKSGERVRITGTRPNGQSCSSIEVLSGAYAWNEDLMGAELIPGEGTATPMPASTVDRMIRLWSGPQGAWKAAMAGAAPDPDAPDMTPRPQQLPADVMTAGKTSVEWAGDKPVVTFPIPGVPEATATATLDDRFMAERVVVTNGADTYEFAYSDYRDWNNPLNPAEAFYAGKMTETKNGSVVRDITTTVTETGQVYVAIPVPASVSANSSSVSPGNPTIKSVLRFKSGMWAWAECTNWLKLAWLVRRAIRFSTRSLPDCRGRCRWGNSRGFCHRAKKSGAMSHGSSEERRRRGMSVWVKMA
jgi:hypothetical protein